MLMFLYDVLFERSFDSSTDWGEKASVGHPFAAGHLQRYLGHGDEKREEREITNVGSCLFYLMFGGL
jgi:hypothetical protein